MGAEQQDGDGFIRLWVFPLKVLVPDPEAYVAVLSVEPVSNSKVGVPPVVTTSTDSEKATAILMTSPVV